MLLNNDYYLDMKDTLMSQELSSIISNTNLLNNAIKEHILNSSIHGAKETIIKNYYSTTIVSGESDTIEAISVNLGLLTADLVVYLSITDSVKAINEKISSIPHNLNGHNLAFLFVVLTNYDETNNKNNEDEMYYEYSIDVGDQCIEFTNFFNGTLFVFGDFLAPTYILDTNRK